MHSLVFIHAAFNTYFRKKKWRLLYGDGNKFPKEKISGQKTRFTLMNKLYFYFWVYEDILQYSSPLFYKKLIQAKIKLIRIRVCTMFV